MLDSLKINLIFFFLTNSFKIFFSGFICINLNRPIQKNKVANSINKPGIPKATWAE